VYAGPYKDRALSPANVNQQNAGSAGPPVAGAIVSTAAETPAGPLPGFEVVAQRNNDRPDAAATYYVVIDPVDPSYDVYKSTVKHVLIALRDNNGGPVFSARIWDHLPAAQTEVSYRSNPDLFSDGMLDARDSLNSRHLIANYAGGLATIGEPPAFVLFWHPEAETGETEEQWPARPISAEVWKP